MTLRYECNLNMEFFTIGYEGASLEDFLASLKNAGIDTLIDIREVPISRKRGFSKSALKSALGGEAVNYVHLKGLGEPKEGRQAARNGNIMRFKEIFATHMNTEKAQNDLMKAAEIINNNRACLLCFERSPKNCHRTIVADFLCSMTGANKINIGVQMGIAKSNKLPGELNEYVESQDTKLE